jgi:hypothetical protein
MSRWHNVRLRADLFRALQAQAAAQSRSVAGQLDFIVTAALERKEATPREPIEGQTTVEEMLASCPNCAETLVEIEGVTGCPCGYTREG